MAVGTSRWDNPLGLPIGTGLSQHNGDTPFGTWIGIGSFHPNSDWDYVPFEFVPTQVGTTWPCPNFDYASLGMSQCRSRLLGFVQLHLGLLGSVPTYFGTAFWLGQFEYTTYTTIVDKDASFRLKALASIFYPQDGIAYFKMMRG